MRFRLFFRLLAIQRVLVRHGLDDLIASTHLLRPFRYLFLLSPWTWGQRKSAAPRAVRIREALQELGPIYVKFGQSVSTRQDILPPDIGAELSKLQAVKHIALAPRPARTATRARVTRAPAP